MTFDFSREALYRPERLTPFGTDRPRPELARRAGELRPLEAWYFSNLAHCAYLEPELLRGVLRRVGLTLNRFVEHNGTEAFIACAPDHAVLAFRGTESGDIRDLKRDLDVTPVEHPSGGRVHSGFYAGAQDVWPELSQALDALGALPVWYTGHSLGAALATLAAVERPPAGLVTFGSPRVGDQEFVDLLSDVPTWRYVDGSDLVTELPPRVIYRHVGTLVFVSETAPPQVEPSAGHVRWHRFRSNLRYALRLPLLRGEVGLRSLVDHAIVNYTAALETAVETGRAARA